MTEKGDKLTPAGERAELGAEAAKSPESRMEIAYRRSRIWSLTILIAIAVVVITTTMGILALRQQADQSRQRQTLLAHLEASVHNISRLEWELAAKRKPARDILVKLNEAVSHSTQIMNQLIRQHPESRHLKMLQRSYSAYIAVTSEEIKLLSKGKFAAAERVNRRRADSMFEKMIETHRQLEHAYDEAAVRAIKLADIGSAATVLAALAALVFLLRYFDRMRQAMQAQTERMLRRSFDMQSALNSILRAGVEDIPLQELLERALDAVLSVSKLAFESRGAVFIVEDGSDRLVMKAQRGLEKPVQESCAIVPFGRCLCGRAAASRQIQFSDRLDDVHETSYEGIDAHGHYCTPILSTGRTLGVLTVSVKEGHHRDPSDEAFLAAACDALAGALMRREAEAALRKERDLLDHVMQTSPIGILTADCRGRITFANARARDLMTLSDEGIADRTHNVLTAKITDLDGRAFQDEKRPFAQVMMTGEAVFGVRYAVCGPKGSRVLLSESMAPLRDQDGRVQGVVSTVQDISQQIEAEEALRRTERALRAISHCNEVLIRATDESSLLKEITQLATDVGGYLLASVDLIDPVRVLERTARHRDSAGSGVEVTTLTWDDLVAGRNPAEESMATGTPYMVHNVLADVIFDERHEDAVRHGYASSMVLPLVADRLVFGTLTIYSAVTRSFEGEEVPLLVELANDLAYGIMSLRTRAERERAQAALSDSEERYRSLVETSPYAVAVHREGRIIYVNAAATQLLGAAAPEDIIGKPALDLVHPDDRERAAARIRTLVEKHREAPLTDERLVRLDGGIVNAEVAASPIIYEGKPAVQVVARDITERKQVDRLKSDFVAMVSHELRTPLAVILGNTQLIERMSKEPQDPAVLKTATRKIRERVTMMTHLVDGLLEVARVSAGAVIPAMQIVDLPKLVADSARSISMTEHHTLKVDVAPALPPVRCDPAQISMAIMNLVSNAVKFSPGGGEIRVGASMKRGHVRISVTDSGIGIAPQVLPHIFDRFTQADMSATRAFGGVGVGLYITRQIVEAHGGRIRVRSTPGKGSTFTIDVPAAEREAAA